MCATFVFVLICMTFGVANAQDPTPTNAPTVSDTSPPSKPDDRPNFIFIFSDDVGFGDLNEVYGHPYAMTPNLDRLTREGTSFKQFHVAGNVCPTSRAGIMTSRHPSLYPNWTEDYSFLGAPTVTKLLKDAGYYVGHIGKWNIGPDPERERIEYGIDDLRLVGGEFDNDDRGREGMRFDAAIDFVEQQKDKQQPFYLNLWIRATHTPIDPPGTLQEPFRNLRVNRDDFGFWMNEKFDTVERRRGNIDRSMRLYLATVYGMDLNIGRLMDKLDQLNMTDNTVVVFTSDNGPEHISSSTLMVGYSGGLRGEKHTFYEGGTRVPFIVRWPRRVPAGVVNDQSIFSGLDWLPTICSLAQCDIPWELIEGEDMSDVWLGESTRSRRNPLLFAVISGAKSAGKYIRYENWKMHEGNQLLFDLDVDPFEMNNIYGDNPDIVQSLKSTLRQWEETLPSNLKMGSGNPLPFDPLIPLTVIGPPDFAPTTSPMPSESPTSQPTSSPTALPSYTPTIGPTVSPSEEPTNRPTDMPTISAAPTVTASPTSSPTIAFSPTAKPSLEPTPIVSTDFPSSMTTATSTQTSASVRIDVILSLIMAFAITML